MPRKSTIRQIGRIKALLSKGKHPKAIAMILNVSVWCIYKAIERNELSKDFMPQSCSRMLHSS